MAKRKQNLTDAELETARMYAQEKYPGTTIESRYFDVIKIYYDGETVASCLREHLTLPKLYEFIDSFVPFYVKKTI